MAEPGQIPGRYNIIIDGTYDTFDNQMPVDDFLHRLKNNDIPDKLTIVGLEQAFEDDDLLNKLGREMDKRANDLEYQSPTIQFVVEGSFHRRGKVYDLRYNNELYPLQDIFGPQIDRKDQDGWLIAPF